MNTKGVYFIDHYIPFWPGGKRAPDSILNSVSDTIFGILGWIIAWLHSQVFPTE